MKIFTNFYLLLSAFCLLPFTAQAQCPTPNKYTDLDVNNIRALIKNNGTHFFRENAEFEVPKGSGKTTVFAASLWLAGKTAQDNLHVAAMRYGQVGNDFWAGPISNDADAGNYYNKFWRVTKQEIDHHIANFGNVGYVAPESIMSWPAHGRTEFGESKDLAPFVNVSGNDTYSPYQGDYPLIRGDEAILWIMNDQCGTHTESKGEPLGVEILGMAYAYSSADFALNHTLFMSYEIRNKTTINYLDFYAALFADFDIGYGYDDYIGCDSLLNLAYGYNGHEIDGNGEPYAYGMNPPAQGAMFLNKKMNSFMYINNDGSDIGDPTKANEYYNYLQGRWKDGTPLTYGGIGFAPGSTNYTKYAFSGDPVTQTGWTELAPDGPSSPPNEPYDRRGLLSTGPFTLDAGDCMSIDIAFPYARDAAGDNVKNVTSLKQNAQAIKNFYISQNYELSCTGNFQPELCEKPTALLGVADANTAVLTWDEPENIDGIITGYNIYRDAMQIETISSDAKEYTDKNLNKGTYVYQVSASYLHCEESELTEGVSVEIIDESIHQYLNNFITIYPNPTTGELQIQSSKFKVQSVEVYDVYGRKVGGKFPFVIPNAVKNPEQYGSQADGVVIDLTDLKSGIYFVKICTEENLTVVKKLVVVK